MSKKKHKISLYLRNGVYYARLWDEETKSYTSGKTTGETDKDTAKTTAHIMANNNEFIKKESDPLFIDELMKFWNNRKELSTAYKRDRINALNNKVVKSKALKDVTMSKVSHAHLNRLIDELKENGDSSGAIQSVLKSITVFCRWAYNRDYLKNDITGKIEKIKVPKTRRGAFTPEQMMKLSNLEWHDLRVKAAVMLGMWAGMRRGEIRALTWGDIDFQTNMIEIKRNFVDDWDKNENPIYKTPKADSTRAWPFLIFPELKNVLLQLYNETPFKGPDDLILCNVWNASNRKNGNPLKQYKPMDDSTIKKQFYKMLEAVDIPRKMQIEKGLTFHSTRHSFVTFVAAVASAGAVMPLSGHDSEKVFENYRKNIAQSSIDALNKANDMMNQYRTPAGNDTPGMIN